MKRAVRIIILMVGLVCTYIVVATPQHAAADGGPLLCKPPQGCPK